MENRIEGLKVEDFVVPGDSGFEQLVAQLAEKLAASRSKLATAESCTGGWIAKCCTDRAGSSDWFDRGFVTYSNASKRELLGVDATTLAKEGAVSQEVAIQMAEGARQRSTADMALAVTGIAGPDGGTEDKPAGTVWFAWAVGKQPADSDVVQFSGDREAVRRQTVAYALQGLLDRIGP